MCAASSASDGGKHSACRGDAARLSKLPLRKRILFVAVLALLPLVVLGAVEGALRLFGFGGYPPTFRMIGRLESGSSLVFTDELGPNSYFFASRSQGLALDPVAFEMPKPGGTVRIMWVGGSAAKGIPQPRPLRGSAFLQAMLSDLWPDRTVEVVNVGTPGIASYPVLDIATESLAYDPDLVVAYLGNNEFYGAFGVSSLHAAGRSPAMVRTTRAVRATAIAQAVDRALRGRVVRDPASLMEAMVGQSHVGPDDPARGAAARNLETFVGVLIDRCRARGVPVIVCTPPCNESGMAPLGEADLSTLGASDAERVAELLAEARSSLEGDPAGAEGSLREAIAMQEDHATAHHLLGRALVLQERFDEAAAEFRLAVDLDPMPWRPPTSSIEAIRRAVRSRDGTLVDLVRVFRDTSATGAVGWDLIEDHVHPSLRGQELVARSIVRALTSFDGLLAVEPDEVEALPDWRTYADRQGANIYDAYAVAHTMRLLGSISFFERSTPEMRARNTMLCRQIESGEHPEVVGQLRRWTNPGSEMVDRFPITGLVAEVKLRHGRPDEAHELYRFAAACSMPYGSRRVAFTYLSLAARRQAMGALAEGDLSVAQRAIDEGRFLIDSGRSASGQCERFVGQLHQLRGEHEQAIPYLLVARTKVSGGHLVATEEALVRAYLATGQAGPARAIVEEGLRGANPSVYQRLVPLLP